MRKQHGNETPGGVASLSFFWSSSAFLEKRFEEWGFYIPIRKGFVDPSGFSPLWSVSNAFVVAIEPPTFATLFLRPFA